MRGSPGTAMKHLVKTGSLGLLIAALLLYLGDAVSFQVKVKRGTAYRVIEVDQFLATPLKGQKVEFDVAGSEQVTCARSIFPQAGGAACWWVERHKTQWQ